MLQRLRPWFVRARARVGVVTDVIPCTPLGAVVMAAALYAMLQYGIRRIDLVLLVLGAVALTVGALSLLVVSITAVVLAVRLRGRRDAEGLNAECDYAARTGFSMSSLWYVPFVKVAWTWVAPDAEVRLVRQRRRIFEEVTPRRRGLHDRIVRRIEVSDAFGLTRVAFRVAETRAVRLVPSVGKLKNMLVVRSIASGEDMPHPGGLPEGERADLRRYTPGDPVRFVLWKVFAKNRQLVVRTPERAISPARQTYAYVVAGERDEAAAGTARVAVETGALGGTWVLGADGAPEHASTRSQALELLARSASCPVGQQGAGLAHFLSRHAHGGASRVVVFVPATPGPWLDRVVASARARSSANQPVPPVEFVVCTDGIARRERNSWLARVALREGVVGALDATPAQQLSDVIARLGAARASVLVVDRRAGRVFAEGHRRALEAAA